MFNVLSALQGCIFLFCLFIIQPWFYPVVKYCFNAIYFTCFIFVNSVIVSSIISCNDLYQDFIIMYVWYFVSRNSISVLGAIWPSLSPYTLINPILLTYLLCPVFSFESNLSVFIKLFRGINCIRWGVLCHNQVSRTGTNNYIPQYLWDVQYIPRNMHTIFVVLCFVVVMQSFIMNSHEVFIHIHQGCFAGTGAIVWLPQCQWSKPDGYGKISQCITTTKHSKPKTVCIFLGIYCNLL